MDWDNITEKVTLIDKIRRCVKKIEKDKILNSVLDFTILLHLIAKK
jgi:hypothetical protein